ncbi:zinc ribbon domain-containing protein [Desulfogranum mediterraneum]|uniref:hypothetical protein n=1 Tax=Desulfogranum mediterraneum TaxID=160661 RepID=UPI0004209A78|nr:hypothetical protein [Desulfogranum mediterraneum]
MIKQCPHCQEQLRFSPEQSAKIEQALSSLDQGKVLKLKCPHCQQSIKLAKSGSSEAEPSGVVPPAPPDLDWLASGAFQQEEKVEDVPMALIQAPPSPQRDQIQEALESVGYQVVAVTGADEAIERMRFVNFACVAHLEEEGVPLAEATIHNYLCQLPMERRRYIFYILISPSLHTLYNLEALALSANLTVNTADLNHLDLVLRKAIPDYEELFGPMMEELNAFGKR